MSEEVENKKNGKGKMIIIAIVVLVVMLIAGVGGYFAYQYMEKQKTIEQEEVKKEEEKRKAEEMKITQSNVLSKIGDHLKFFSGCYLGRIYGIENMYKTVDVTGKVNVPGTDSSYEMTYEVVELNSIASLNANFEKCMTKEVISKLKGSSYGDVTKNLHDYKGKVYWVIGGIGDGLSMDYKKAKVISSEGDTSIVQVEEFADLLGEVTAKIDLTIKYDEATSSFKITNYTKKNV